MSYTKTPIILFNEVQTENLYKDLLRLKTDLDLSSYPFDHLLFDQKKTKKVSPNLSDVLNGFVVVEVIFLKQKEYSIAYLDGSELKTEPGKKQLTVR